ncbi:hypothetical protein NC651_019092 [Populus alba x Populus x berolinensis]|nr:hypothetical protein NC651_019092 [Populus alba x Populus x berolinensis]
MDVVFPCSSVEFAFKVWQSAPNAMVGFVPRAHWVDKTIGENGDYYTYGGWLVCLVDRALYSMGLIKEEDANGAWELSDPKETLGDREKHDSREKFISTLNTVVKYLKSGSTGISSLVVDTVREERRLRSVDLLLSLGECPWYPLLLWLLTAVKSGFGECLRFIS